jgi:hypothetical protein
VLVQTKRRGFKRLGERVMARTFERQVAQVQAQAQAHVRVALLNRFTQLGRPTTVPVVAMAWHRCVWGWGWGHLVALSACATKSRPPTTGTNTSRITYEARETINVLGRRYGTCRYKIRGAGDDINFNWYTFGSGLPARVESRNASGAVLLRSEPKSAVLNGTAR